MISIDEAIAHAREVAKDNRSICTVTDKGCDKFSKCLQCAEEHEQLAEWLEELQNLKAENTYLHDEMQAIGATMGLIEKEIRNKAIDDFLREIKIDVIATTFGLRICDAERIAQQLKEGVNNESDC